MEVAARLLGYDAPGHKEIPLQESLLYVSTTPGSNLEAIHRNFLAPIGWLKSRQLRKPVDAEGSPIPWLTYPSLSFLRAIDSEKMSVIEFGGGASTAWFSQKFKTVLCIESDPGYKADIEQLVGPNTTVLDFSQIVPGPSPFEVPKEILESDEAELPSSHREDFLRRLHFLAESLCEADVIVIDGGPRNTYLWLARQYCKTESLIVVDNSDQPYTQMGLSQFSSPEFLKIPFSGLHPLNSYIGETTIILSVLGIRKPEFLRKISS